MDTEYLLDIQISTIQNVSIIQEIDQSGILVTEMTGIIFPQNSKYKNKFQILLSSLCDKDFMFKINSERNVISTFLNTPVLDDKQDLVRQLSYASECCLLPSYY